MQSYNWNFSNNKNELAKKPIWKMKKGFQTFTKILIYI